MTTNRQEAEQRPWRLRAGWWVLACVTAGFCVGCPSNGKQSDADRIVARPVPFVPDVPVPAGFAWDEKNSQDYGSGGMRIVRHEYRGKADRAALRDFYRDQMPSYRWRLITDQSVEGVITLRFEKGDESCVVTLRPVSGLGANTVINVTILPFERTGSEPPARGRG